MYDSNGMGNGTVSFAVEPNFGLVRSGTIGVGGKTFTVNQGTNCTYSISPTSVTIPSSGAGGSFTVTTATACERLAISNNPWIDVTAGGVGTGSGTVTFSVQPNSGATRIGTITAGGQTFTVNQLVSSVVSISGRVLTPSGLGLRNAVVTLTDSQGVRQIATTSSFGVYTFENVRSGETYFIGVSSKRYRFAARSVNVSSDLTGVDFVGLE